MSIEVSANIGSAEADNTSSWVTKDPMPTVGSGFKAGVINDEIYLFKFNLTYEYDPPNWATKTPMPTSRDYFALATCPNEIYCIGGRNIDGISAVNEVYDPATDTWTSKAAMPTARGGMDGNVVNGKIYVISGVVQDPLWPNIKGTYVGTKVTEVYDVATDTWTTKTPIPTAVSFYASAVVGTKIYIIQGITQIYDTQTDTWSYGTSPPYGVEFAGCAIVGELDPHRIYVIGGRVDLEESYTQIYDTETDSWSFGAPLPTARFGLATAVLDNKIYAVGGVKGSFYNTIQLDANEMYDPIKDPSAPPLPTQTPTFTAAPPVTQQPAWNSREIAVIAVAFAVGIIALSIALIIYNKRRINK